MSSPLPAAPDFSSSSFFTDPYPAYARLREGRMPQCIGGVWYVSGYRDVAALLNDSRLSKLTGNERPQPLDFAMLFQDPPTHTRLRGLVSQAFTPRRIKTLEEQIEKTADSLIERVAARGGMDFVSDFATPFPVTIIAEMLGIPEQDRAMFYAHAVAFVANSDLAESRAESGRKQGDSMGALLQYFGELIARRRREPKDDILSSLIEAQDRLSAQELIGNCILLLIAGHETTTNLFGNGLFTLLRQPERWAALKADPGLIGSAVEEILRYESPVQHGTFRVTTEPIELGGVLIPQGQRVTVVLAAANRDPSQFPDPDRFEIAREPNRHLGFGLGVHFCLGASLARLEARIGFTRLLSRFPDLRLAQTEPDWMPASLVNVFRQRGWSSPWSTPFKPSWRPNVIIRGLKTLPVIW